MLSPYKKRGLIGEIRIYNLNNQEQEFFVEFVDHRKKHRLFIFHSLEAMLLSLMDHGSIHDRQENKIITSKAPFLEEIFQEIEQIINDHLPPVLTI